MTARVDSDPSLNVVLNVPRATIAQGWQIHPANAAWIDWTDEEEALEPRPTRVRGIAAIRRTNVVTAASRLARAVLEDPVEMAIEMRERFAEHAERRASRKHGGGFMPWPPCPYEEDENWEQALHQVLGEPWPCPHTAEFAQLWPRVIDPLTSAGMTLGRGAFAGWGDGEPGFARAIWCLTRHLRPAKVVETGVARGITSRFILEAMTANGDGRLWGIDRPPPGRPDLREQIAAAVPTSLRSRWSYVKGSSRRRLPVLLDAIGEIDLFVHDSRHSERNVLYELARACEAVRSGGFFVVDDVDLNCGLHRYRREHPHDRVLVCPAEPLQPDPPRQNAHGAFAVISPSRDTQS